MNYDQTIDYLYNQRPAFERQGAGGYKPGLQTSRDLDALFGHPHRNYRIIHIAGTNGKGSVSHMLAAMLQLNGYRVGLFTSPHFVDFRERIRVNGQMISRQEVVHFVDEFHLKNYVGTPSFFELTSTMAFRYFADQHVDIAVIETGLGGRLDSTNIVTPILSIITNVSFDHTEFLGDTLPQIAAEKAGIIKAGVPVVVGEADGELDGDYQRHNINTVLAAELVLEQLGLNLSPELVNKSFNRVSATTGLMGRWMTVGSEPCRIICDSGHNIAGINCVVEQLRHERCDHLHMVVGFMRDKDLKHILPLLPREATYYFTQAPTPRALPASELRNMAQELGLEGNDYPDVMTALRAARSVASSADLIFVGGSMYVLADLFAHLTPQP